MKRLFIVLLEVAFLLSLGFLVYFNYRLGKEDRARPSRLIMLTDRRQFLGSELEEKLTFYLARQLGIYEGQFEIVDVMNLGTAEIAGVDYILVTIRIPGGKLVQVTLSRAANPWASWELDEKSLSLVELPRPDIYVRLEAATWLKELGITEEQVNQYLNAHPEITSGDELEAAFRDAKSGSPALPKDWWDAVAFESSFSLEIKPDKTPRIVSGQGKGKDASSYWKVDYPAEYTGPGYRAYLYDKVKSERNK